MIKWLVNWLWGDMIQAEKESILADSKSILAECEKAKSIQYINFDYVNLDTEHFLYGMQQFSKNKFLLSWLLHKRVGCEAAGEMALARHDDRVVVRAAAQVSIIKSLIVDLNTFDNKLKTIIDKKKKVKNANRK